MLTHHLKADSPELHPAASEGLRARPISGGCEGGSATLHGDPYDENFQFLEAYRADPDRQREAFYLRDVKNVPRLEPHSAVPEYVIVVGIVCVLVVLVYFALGLLLRSN